MLANRFQAGLISGVISLDYDSPAVREKEEAVSCKSVAETHSDVVAAIHLRRMSGVIAGSGTWGPGRRLLGACFRYESKRHPGGEEKPKPKVQTENR